MAMVNVVTIAAYRRIYWLRLIGLVQRSAATWRCVLHSSDEPGELSQWQCTATMTVPIIIIIIIITATAGRCDTAAECDEKPAAERRRPTDCGQASDGSDTETTVRTGRSLRESTDNWQLATSSSHTCRTILT